MKQFIRLLCSELALVGGNLLGNLILALLVVCGLHLELELLLALFLGSRSTSRLFGAHRLCANFLMSLLVNVLERIRFDTSGNVAGKLALVRFIVFLDEVLHVLLHVNAVDVVAQQLGIGLLLGTVVAGEAGLGVRDRKTAINSALEGTKDARASGGALEATVEEGLEGAGSVIDRLDRKVLSVGLGAALVLLMHAELGKQAAGQQKPGAVRSRPVGEAVVDAVARQLVCVGRGDDDVADDARVNDLADDVLVGEAHAEAVLGGVVLVLCLGDQALAGVVVGLALWINKEKHQIGAKAWSAVY